MRRHRATPVIAVIVSTLPLGCAGTPGPAPGPAIDAPEAAQLQEERTQLVEPLRVIFEWNINEAGARFRGRGVARMEPPYRARLDLFLANGEPVVQAALVNDDLRLPAAAPPGLIPPPPLLWASLGVFRPGARSELLGGESLGTNGAQLRYRLRDGTELRYEMVAGRITAAELMRDGEVEERMELERGEADGQLPSEATYRNIAAFRELVVRAEQVEPAASYPPEIWTLGR